MLVVAWKLFALVSLLSTVVTLTSLIWPSPLLLMTSMAIMAGEVLLEDHQEELEQVLTMNDAFIQEF